MELPSQSIYPSRSHPRRPAAHPKAEAEARRRKHGQPSRKAAVKPTRAASYRHPASDEHVNDDYHADWIVAKGIDFLELFPDRAPGAKRWPKFTDTRLPKKNKQPRAAPLCVRFQMTGRCKYGCTMAHIGASTMTMPEFNQADRLIKAALKAKPGTGT